MKDILQEITRLRLARGWSEYELAQNSGLTQSTISTWYRKSQTPTIQTLDKVCRGLGISLSQFLLKALTQYTSLMNKEKCWTIGQH